MAELLISKGVNAKNIIVKILGIYIYSATILATRRYITNIVLSYLWMKNAISILNKSLKN